MSNARFLMLYNLPVIMAKVDKNSEKKTRGGSKPGERRGGRQKGTPNKKTLEFVEALGSFDPVNALIDLYEKTKDDGIKLGCLKEMLKYIYPQRKAIEMSSEEEKGFTININRKAVESDSN